MSGLQEVLVNYGGRHTLIPMVLVTNDPPKAMNCYIAVPTHYLGRHSKSELNHTSDARKLFCFKRQTIR